MKKVISLLLVCMMVLSMVTVVSATNVCTVSVDSVDASSVAIGGTIVVPIRIDNVPDGQARIFSVIVTFDPEKIEYVGASAFEDDTYAVQAMSALNTRTNRLSSDPIELTSTSAANANTQGWAKVEYSNSGSAVIADASISANDVLSFLNFKKLEGVAGEVTLGISEIQIVDQATSSTGVQYSLTSTPNYVKAVAGTVTLSIVEKYDITHTQGTGYTTNLVAGEKVKAEGDTVSFTVTPDTGYQIDSVKMNGADVSVNEGTYSFTMPDAAANVVITASKETYTITKGAGSAGGEFAVATTANYGDTVTITADPDSEYFTPVYSVTKTEGGAEVTVTPNGNTATFTMPAEDVTVNVTFEAIPTYAVEVADGITNGTVTAKSVAAEGETVAITATPDAGYAIGSITVMAGETNIPVENNSFTMPAANVTITATFTEIVYIITVDSAIENGTVSYAQGEGDTIILTNTPDAGYELEAYTVTATDGTPVEVTDGTFQLTQDVNVTATFKKADYAITVADGENFVATGLVPTAQYGDEVVFTVSPAIGYEVAVTCEDALITSNGDNAYSFTMPAKAITINVAASLINYDIIKSALEGVVITVAATANYNEVVTFTATAPVGYVIDTVTVNDGDIAVTEEGGVYSFTMPDSDVTIKATSKVDPFMDARIEAITVNGQNAVAVSDDAYTVTLNVYAKTANINVVTVEDAATVEINGIAGKTVADDIYSNTEVHTVVVTAEDGVTTKNYTLTVTNGIQATARPASSVGTAGSTLADIKSGVSSDIDKAVEELNKDDYSEEAWAEIEKLIEDAKADLDDAKNTNAAKKIKTELLDAIADVETLEESDEKEPEKLPVDDTIEPAVIAAPEKTEEEIAAAEELYSDMDGHWALPYVHELSIVNSVFKGNEDGTFAPDDGITRQEIAVAFGRLLGLEEIVAEITATDFADDTEIADWAKGYVAVMNELGLLMGNADGSFNPEGVITREQLALIISRMMDAPEAVAALNFNDAEKISDWAMDGCAVAYTYGIIKGYPDNTFKGSNKVTRAEATVMICNLVSVLTAEEVTEEEAEVIEEVAEEATEEVTEEATEEVIEE